MAAFEAWLALHGPLTTFAVSVVGAIVTLCAVLVAWRTAASTRATVAEMREARLQAVRPVLYASAVQRGFEISLQPDKTTDPQLIFREVAGKVSPPFEIRNAVESPAFDVTCRWLLGSEAKLDSEFRLASLKQAAERKKCKLSYEPGVIKVIDGDGDFGFFDNWEYSRDVSTTHLEILGGKAKGIQFPDKISKQIVCLALLRAERQQIYNEPVEEKVLPLTITINCKAPSGEAVTKSFSFRISIGFSLYFKPDDEIYPRGQLPSDWKQVRISCRLAPIVDEQIVLVNPTAADLVAAALRSTIDSVVKGFVFRY